MVGDVKDLEINASEPIEIGYEVGGSWYGRRVTICVWREMGEINVSEGKSSGNPNYLNHLPQHKAIHRSGILLNSLDIVLL